MSIKVDNASVVDTETDQELGRLVQLKKIDFREHPKDLFEFVPALGRDGKPTASLSVRRNGLVLAGITGAFATRFPKTKPAISTFGAKDTVNVASDTVATASKRQKSERYCVSVDISTDFKDSTDAVAFVIFCERLDQLLVDFYVQNPSLLGLSRSTTRDTIEAHLKRTFKVNVSKNGVEYPPSASFYKQAYNELDARVEIMDRLGNKLPDSFVVPQDSVIRVGVMYTGPKVHLGNYSNGWTLLKVQYLGSISDRDWPGFTSESVTRYDDEKIAEASSVVQFGDYDAL